MSATLVHIILKAARFAVIASLPLAGVSGVFLAGAFAAPESEFAPGQKNAPGPEDASGTGSTAENDPLMHIWRSRTGELAVMAKEVSSLRGNAESMAAPLSESIQAAGAQASRLSNLFQALRGHPMEQLTLLRQMLHLQEKLRNNLRPLEDIAAAVKRRLEDLASLQKDMDDLSRDSLRDGETAGAAPAEIKDFTRTALEARAKLGGASARLEKILAPAKAAETRLGRTVENTESSLMEIWRSYYLTPSNADAGVLAAIPGMLSDWVGHIPLRVRFAYPQNGEDWKEAGKSFTSASALIALFGFLLLRSTHILSTSRYHACADVFKGAWIGVGGGFAVLAASSNPAGGSFLAFTFLGVLAVIAGAAALSRRLRAAVMPALQDAPSPLNRLLPPAFLGVFMLFSDLPPPVLSLMWTAIMLVFLARTLILNRQRAAALPLLESLAFSCAFWAGSLSLAAALFGYARLAVLLFMALFALVNICTLGNALTALLQNLGDSLFDKENRPIRHAIAEALSTPAAWILSLVCALPWLWAVPGARYLLRSAMAANYTWGEASFNFSRLLFIAVLFFLTRSFIGLLTTSLSHLPDHIPHIERGVIPPLRTMVRYLSWALFAIIVLGSLGVDFTSLAVIAGGLSVGIGFGVQNLFNNLISGLILIFGRTILVGDIVDVAGVSGTVKSINIRSTAIETPEHALVYVPNSSIMSGHFSNWTRLNRVVRRSMRIGVAYGSDTALVTRLLLEAADTQEHVRKTPPPTVLFSEFGPHSLEFTLHVFMNIDDSPAALSAIRFSINRSFAERGIEIPFPQLALHMTPPAANAVRPAEHSAPARHPPE
ncbi:MAG: mechanosensitive ion channel [Desulfovibrio sp.]|jgi:small-conductance mechanosensitive channel|nr:mechanosensitive ion channel [Desulfovibrio sp.]